MKNQAEELRKLAESRGITREQKIQRMVGDVRELMTHKVPDEIETVPQYNLEKVIAVTSGKGGVGKTSITANLAVAFQMLGKETILLDADMGMANADVILGCRAEKNIFHILSGQCSLEQALTIGPRGIKFIAGGSGIAELANIGERERNFFVENFSLLERLGQILLIDTGAGISKNVLCFVLAAREVIVVVTPEPTSIADAYGVIKTAVIEKPDVVIKLVINRVRSEDQAIQVFSKMNGAAVRFLGKSLEFLGAIPEDEMVWEAVLTRRPFIALNPDSQASKAVLSIASKLSASYGIEEKLFGTRESGKNKNMIKNLVGFINTYLIR